MAFRSWFKEYRFSFRSLPFCFLRLCGPCGCPLTPLRKEAFHPSTAHLRSNPLDTAMIFPLYALSPLPLDAMCWYRKSLEQVIPVHRFFLSFSHLWLPTSTPPHFFGIPASEDRFGLKPFSPNLDLVLCRAFLGTPISPPAASFLCRAHVN